MGRTCVVNLQFEGCDVYIGRNGIWGNPFIIGRDGTREEVIKKYAEWIKTRPDLLELIPTLKGKRLGCFCTPQACHGDLLVEMADKTGED